MVCLQALTESTQSRWLQPGLRWRLAAWAIHRRFLEPMKFLPQSRSKRIRFSLRRPSQSVTVPRRRKKSPVLLPHLRQRISMPVSRQALSAFFRVRLPALTSAALQATLPARGITSRYAVSRLLEKEQARHLSMLWTVFRQTISTISLLRISLRWMSSRTVLLLRFMEQEVPTASFSSQPSAAQLRVRAS